MLFRFAGFLKLCFVGFDARGKISINLWCTKFNPFDLNFLNCFPYVFIKLSGFAFSTCKMYVELPEIDVFAS